MSTDVPIGSPQRSTPITATIIPFPAGGRRGLKTGSGDARPSVEAIAPQVTVSGAWYHDAAIQDGKRAGEC